MFKVVSCAAILSLCVASPVSASPELLIEDFVGRVLIKTTSDSQISIVTEQNIDDVQIYESGKSLKIDGGIPKPNGRNCKGLHGSISISLFKSEKHGRIGGYKNLRDYPKITINAPKDTTLIVRNSIPFLIADDLGAANLNLSSCGKVQLGDLSNNLEAHIRGSADLYLGDIGGNADIEVHGSGGIDMGDAKDLRLEVSGSGDVDARNITSADISVRGSGDVELGNISGPLGVESRGSSDIDIGRVSGDFIYDGRGSGDLDIDSVIGRISVDVSGSGDVSIDGGKAQSLKVSASGASDFDFGGIAETADLYASGASDIYVKKVTGEVRSKETGAADIDID